LYPASLIPGLRELGQFPFYTWGNVFPRTGWSTQSSEPKAAALVAQRAGDIVTRHGQPHVYWPVRSDSWIWNDYVSRFDEWVSDGVGGLVNHWFLLFSGVKVWPPPPLKERDASTGYWQMLYPNTEVSCRVFGANDMVGLSDWGGGKVSSGGEYAWTLWRPYSCCKKKGQVFLGSVDFGG